MNLTNILDMMGQYGLTADECLLIYLTFLARDEEGHSEYFTRWYNEGGKDRLKEMFKSLQDKGVILKSYNPTGYKPNEIEFNSIFLKRWFKYSNEFGMELFNAYPPFLHQNGVEYTLRDVSKRFACLEDFCFFYGTQIGFNPDTHKEIMEILEWAKENNLINFGILNFTVSRQWLALKQLRENPEISIISRNSIYLDE